MRVLNGVVIALCLLVLCSGVFAGDWKPAGDKNTTKWGKEVPHSLIDDAPAPLFEDPVWHGPADPEIIWNPISKEWNIFYTQRRATLPNPDGVKWAHGTAIGIAASKDGKKWEYAGICKGDETLEDPVKHNCSWWAPCVVFDGKSFHMFVTWVDGIYSKWGGKRYIKHFTSTNGTEWKYLSTLKLSSESCIDASVCKVGNHWRMWYKNEDQKTWSARSPDLNNWTVVGPAVTDMPHEAPFVWKWKGSYWMTTDAWRNGLRIYSSKDGISDWTYHSTILSEPGTARSKDTFRGSHPSVIRQGDRCFVFYHVHFREQEKPYNKTALQIAELEMDVDNRIVCDRDKLANNSQQNNSPDKK